MIEAWLRDRWLAARVPARASQWARRELLRDPVGAILAAEHGWGAGAEAAVDPVPLDRARGRAERALRGQVFTPAPVAAALCRIADVTRRRSDPRILDPACGDGGLLVAALDARVAAGWDAAEALASVVGVDVDPAAAFAARAALVAWAVSRGVEGPVDVRCADALAGTPADPAGRFGVVLANPPFLEAKRMSALPGLARRLRATIPDLSGAFDLYLAFCLRALDQLADDGAAAFVLPNKVLVARYAEGFRARVDRGPVRLTALVDASHARPRLFERTGVYPVLLGLGRGEGPTRVGRVEEPASLAALAPERLPSVDLRGAPAWFAPRTDTWPVLRGLLGGVPLGAVAAIRSTCSFHQRGLRERYVTPERAGEPSFPYLGGPSRAQETEVRPFRIRWAGWWIRWDADGLAAQRNPLPPLGTFQRPKVILCQHGPRVRAAADPDGTFVTKDVYPVAWPSHPAWTVWELAAVLNSTVFTSLYSTLFHGVTCGSETYHYLPAFLARVPVPPVERLGDAAELARRAQDGEEGAWLAADRAVTAAWGLDEADRLQLVAEHLDRVGAEAPDGPPTSRRSPIPT